MLQVVWPFRSQPQSDEVELLLQLQQLLADRYRRNQAEARQMRRLEPGSARRVAYHNVRAFHCDRGTRANLADTRWSADAHAVRRAVVGDELGGRALLCGEGDNTEAEAMKCCYRIFACMCHQAAPFSRRR